MDYLVCTLLTGAGATVLLDAWAIVRRRWLGIALPDYGLVGRWLAHLARGRFLHASIATSAPVRGERLVGWTAHYLIGIAFAAILIGTQGLAWVREPTLAPALVVGLATVAAPFLVLQPGMGAGIAARRTARPGAARIQSLVTHGVFGFGLYVAGWAARLYYVS